MDGIFGPMETGTRGIGKGIRVMGGGGMFMGKNSRRKLGYGLMISL